MCVCVRARVYTHVCMFANRSPRQQATRTYTRTHVHTRGRTLREDAYEGSAQSATEASALDMRARLQAGLRQDVKGLAAYPLFSAKVRDAGGVLLR